MLKLQAILQYLLDKKMDKQTLVKTKTITKSYSIQAGGYTPVTLTQADLSVPGYIPVGVVQVTTGHIHLVKISGWNIPQTGDGSVSLTCQGYDKAISTSTLTVVIAYVWGGSSG